MQHQSSVSCPNTAGPATSVATNAGHRHRDRQPVQARDLVADALGQQDVGRPAGRPRPARTPRRPVDRAVPRLGEQHTPTAASAGHTSAPRPAARTATPSGPRNSSALAVPSGSPGDRGHEQQRQAGGHDAERDAREQAARVNADAPRPHQHQQEQTRPGQPQPGCALGADPVEQADRQRPARAGHSSIETTAITVPAPCAERVTVSMTTSETPSNRSRPRDIS